MGRSLRYDPTQHRTNILTDTQRRPGAADALTIKPYIDHADSCTLYILYVQEVVTLQKKYLIYLHQKMRLTPFINYYDTLG